MINQKILMLVSACVIVFLMILIERYFPWNRILRKDVSGTMAYIMGILTIAIPFMILIALFPHWERDEVLNCFGILIGAAGAGTIFTRVLDAVIHNRDRADEGEEREKALLSEVKK
jgi:drug/metabolite transporter (DMT)-like permease